MSWEFNCRYIQINVNFSKNRETKEKWLKWSKINSRLRNFQLTVVPCHDGSAAGDLGWKQKGKKEQERIEYNVEDRNRGGASRERLWKKRLKNGRCFRRCTKGKCSDCRERKRAFRLTEYTGEIGSWSMETLQGHFLRSSLRKSKKIKCTNRIKIEDANRNDNRNLTLYRIYIILYNTHTRVRIYFVTKKNLEPNWTRRSHEKLTRVILYSYSISCTIHLNHHFHEQLRASA